MNEHSKVYWHEAFFEALKLELHQYKDALEFQKEHHLSKEALRMDVLIIKKNKDIRIEKNIGRIFKEHNIFEYKSESDSFSIWDYNKILGYGFLYSSFERIPMSDITLSIALTIYPRELIKFLENERGLKVRDLGDGIYHIDGDIIPVQILESKKLSPDSNLFLRNLRSNLSAKDMLDTLQAYEEQKFLNERNVYLDRLVRANLVAFKEAIKMNESINMTFHEILLEAAEENGWLNDKFVERKKIAKKLLLLGDSVEKVAEATELPIETVIALM